MGIRRVLRIILGIILLGLFIAFTYFKTENIIWSRDMEQLALQAEVKAAEEEAAAASPAPAAEETTETPEPSAEPEATPEPTPEPTPDPDSPSAKAAELGLPEPPDIDINSWEFLLVNKDHTISDTFIPDTATATSKTSSCEVDARIKEPLETMAAACEAAGYPCYLSSGYRSYSEQMYLFNRKVNQGYSYEVAKTIVAYPGTSEHQTGLCCDITDIYRSSKGSELENTNTYKWLVEHCSEYGFVVRYPADKSGGADTITGIIYEPWHFRYVGEEAAKYMTENNLCLEEFVELYSSQLASSDSADSASAETTSA